MPIINHIYTNHILYIPNPPLRGGQDLEAGANNDSIFHTPHTIYQPYPICTMYHVPCTIYQPYTIYVRGGQDLEGEADGESALHGNQQEVCELAVLVGLAAFPTVYQTGKCRAHKADESHTMYHESYTIYHVSYTMDHAQRG